MSHIRLALTACIFSTACSKDELREPSPPVMGVVDICTDVPVEDDTLHAFSGVVVAMDDGSTDCTHSITIEDADGERHTVGWSVTDDDGADHTPAADVAPGDSISLGVRAYMVFGDVRGLLITDDDGLLLAADEGTWGGGLREEETGLVISHGPTTAETETECITTTYSDVWLEADSTWGLEPLRPLEVELDGDALTVMMVSSIEYGPGTECEVSDRTDELAWVAWR